MSSSRGYAGGRSKCTPEQAGDVVAAIVAGASLTGAAEYVGRSRSWLTQVLADDPDLHERVVKARGSLEVRYSLEIDAAVTKADGPLVNALVKRRANRFPQRHGEDPRLRHAMDVAGDEHPEDLAASRPQTVDADVAIIRRLADRMIAEDET
jgi:hypothetical protein